MNKTTSKSRLAIILSRLKVFESPKIGWEQYATDSEVAASMIWNAYLIGDIEGKVIADLGCGTGILGIGALLLGAKKVFLIDADEKALETARENVTKVKSEGYGLGQVMFRCHDISNIKDSADVVLQNPPFGTKKRHADIIFLEKALEAAPVVYSFHKSENNGFFERFSTKKNAKITHVWPFKLPLKSTFSFHRRQIHRIEVSCLRFEKTD